ncbi:unnamed protein product [Ilex paraguariensis]|uniref:RING-type E3 ubiquitin transferase n=1 Tax=Ilex paraguariensis TaxID=185542 RepID=A0ABC8TF61_9AQUA
MGSKGKYGTDKRMQEYSFQLGSLKPVWAYPIHRNKGMVSIRDPTFRQMSFSWGLHFSHLGRSKVLAPNPTRNEFQVDGARFFDVDACSELLVIARRLSGMGGKHVLTKMSLIAPDEREDIQLPVSTKAVKDLHVSPHGRLALFASLGKKLSVLSMDSNNTILTYDLPAAAWSCSWDSSGSQYIYAGLQNGMLLEFDMRQTDRPVESMTGLTDNPIHTLQSLSPHGTIHSGIRTLLTASSVGLCQWNFGGAEER